MRILIVDDHPLTCAGLKMLLEANYPDAHIGAAHSACAAREELEAGGVPDWLFLDIYLPDDPGHLLFEWLCRTGGVTKTILISAEVDGGKLRYALECGVRGFIPKSAEPEALLEGFSAIRGGEIYLPPKFDGLTKAPPHKPLTPRQEEVYRLLLKGRSNKLIARDLNLSEYTVKEYVSSILNCYGVKDRLELVLKVRG